jgi:hypothetical protein
MPTLIADPSVFFIFQTHIFLNSILAKRTLAYLQAAQADTQTQACKGANYATAPLNSDVSYLYCQAYPDY